MEKKKITNTTLKKIVIGAFAFIIIAMAIIIPIVGHVNKQYRFSFDNEKFLGKKDLTNFNKFDDFELEINYVKHNEPEETEDETFINGKYEFELTYKKNKVRQDSISAKLILIYPKDNYTSSVASTSLTHDVAKNINVSYNNPNPKNNSKNIFLYIQIQYNVSVGSSSTLKTLYFRILVEDIINK